jgi:nicotinate phosphoribosyltransferase
MNCFVSKIPMINNKHIIQYLTDIDCYKLFMLQFILHQFPQTTAKYKFKNRTKNINLVKYINEINNEIDWLCSLRFQEFEINALSKVSNIFKADFISFLKTFKLNREYIKVFIDSNNKLAIEAEGTWLNVMMFEIYILAIVEEIYTKNTYNKDVINEARERLEKKIKIIKDFDLDLLIMEFGTRRRFSLLWQEEVISELSKLPSNKFIGTSNILFAILYNIPFKGTQAHEILQAGQILSGNPLDCNTFILDKWAREYKGELGIALTDVIGMDKFLYDFNLYFTKLYNGARHDSGNPYIWVDKLINHYKKLGIDPLVKNAVFSDGLNVFNAINLRNYCNGKINTSYGIGTDLTNDMGVGALQLVMKIVECNGKPVAKLPDSEGKEMCEDIKYSKKLQEDIKKQLISRSC